MHLSNIPAAKRLLIISLALISSLAAVCLPPAGRQRNTVYVLDCTKSMNGYNGAPDIWSDTKDFLRNAIMKEARENPDAAVTILPFQERVLSPVKIDLRNFNWAENEAILNRHIERITATNICDAWQEAVKNLDATCENYIVLMTDGHDNIGGTANEGQRINKLVRILEEFCGKYHNTKGIYVELTKQATLPDAILRAIENCDDLSRISAIDGIPSFGCFSANDINVNTRDLPADIPVGFSNSGSFAASLSNADNEFVKISIKGGRINGGKFVLHIESKYGDNIELLNKAIGSSNAVIPFEVKSDSVAITQPHFELNLLNTPLRTLNLQGLDKDLNIGASAKRTRPFLWITGNPIDTLRWDLAPEFNKYADDDEAQAMYLIKSATDIADCRILYNGTEVTDSTITFTPGESGLIELLIPQDKTDGKMHLTLKLIRASELDRINDLKPDDVGIALFGSYDTSMSLLEIIAWSLLGLIVFVAIIWFAFIRNSRYPKFKKGIIYIQSPYFASIKVAGKRMIVITPVGKRQGWLDSLIKGKVTYHCNPTWPCNVLVTPSGKRNMKFACPSGRLVCDPSPLLGAGNEYKIIDIATNKPIAEININ